MTDLTRGFTYEWRNFRRQPFSAVAQGVKDFRIVAPAIWRGVDIRAVSRFAADVDFAVAVEHAQGIARGVAVHCQRLGNVCDR